MSDLTLSVGFEDGALDDFTAELDDVATLAKRGQLTEPEALEWADQAKNDLLDRVEIREVRD